LDIDFEDINLISKVNELGFHDEIYILKIYIQSSEHLHYKMRIENC